MNQALSLNLKRNKAYTEFLASCSQHRATVGDMIQLGTKLMSKAKLHHHFFRDFTWKAQAEALVEYAFQLAQVDYKLSDKLDETMALSIIALFEKRIEERVPVEYITHKAYYLGNTFYVNEHVLIPRSIMHHRFEDFLNDVPWENDRVLDLCTGSGCIGITLALLNPRIHVDLADISPDALEVAKMNVKKYWLEDRVKCIQSDVFDNIHQKYDLIITNPPYVSQKEYQKSAEEFKTEPRMALEAGEDGLSIIRRILSQAKHYLNPNGILIAEVGISAAQLIKKQYPQVKFQWLKYRRPSGKESFFGGHGVFLCHANALEALEAMD